MKVFRHFDGQVGTEVMLNVRTDIKAEMMIGKRFIFFYIGSIKEQKDWPLIEFWRPIKKNVDIFCHFKNFWGPSIYKRRFWEALKEKGEKNEDL